jgi:hypothetical protein
MTEEQPPSQVGHIKDDVAELKSLVAALKSDVKHLPSKGFIVVAVMVALALFSAVTLFQVNIYPSLFSHKIEPFYGPPLQVAPPAR